MPGRMADQYGLPKKSTTVDSLWSTNLSMVVGLSLARTTRAAIPMTAYMRSGGAQPRGDCRQTDGRHGERSMHALAGVDGEQGEGERQQSNEESATNRGMNRGDYKDGRNRHRKFGEIASRLGVPVQTIQANLFGLRDHFHQQDAAQNKAAHGTCAEHRTLSDWRSRQPEYDRGCIEREANPRNRLAGSKHRGVAQGR